MTARIRVLKVKGRNGNKPKVVYLHSNNFDKYTSKKGGKYNVAAVSKSQKSKFLNNQIRAYSASVRLHA